MRKENKELQNKMKSKTTTVVEALGVVVFGILTVIMLLQGGRLWHLFEKVLILETKVEMLHEIEIKHTPHEHDEG